METSAKAGHNVKSLFKKIAMSLPGMEKENQNTEGQNTSQCFLVGGWIFLNTLSPMQRSTSRNQVKMRSRKHQIVSAEQYTSCSALDRLDTGVG